MANSYHEPTNARCCDGGNADAVAIIAFSLLVLGLCLMIFVFSRLSKRLVLETQLEEDAASHDRKEERRRDSTRDRKEFISNELIVKELVPKDNQQVVESTKGKQDIPPSGKAVEVEAPQPLSPPINSFSPASCPMGSDDCDSLAEEEEMAGCAICLSSFKPQQLVCESNNSSCQHVFHKDCMVDWLMKHHDECPMCREVYVLKTVY
jgi:hypothetical protein